MAAVRIVELVDRLRALDESGLGAANDSAAGDPLVARALADAYQAWVSGLKVLINDSQLMAEHLAATAHSTALVSHQLADQIALLTPDPATIPPQRDVAVAQDVSLTGPTEVRRRALVDGYAPGKIETALHPATPNITTSNTGTHVGGTDTEDTVFGQVS